MLLKNPDVCQFLDIVVVIFGSNSQRQYQKCLSHLPKAILEAAGRQPMAADRLLFGGAEHPPRKGQGSRV